MDGCLSSLKSNVRWSKVEMYKPNASDCRLSNCCLRPSMDAAPQGSLQRFAIKICSVDLGILSQGLRTLYAQVRVVVALGQKRSDECFG